jgi:hypothetical protein
MGNFVFSFEVALTKTICHIISKLTRIQFPKPYKSILILIELNEKGRGKWFFSIIEYNENRKTHSKSL